MERLEVSGAVRPLYGSLGVKGLINIHLEQPRKIPDVSRNMAGNLSCVWRHWTNLRALPSALCFGQFLFKVMFSCTVSLTCDANNYFSGSSLKNPWKHLA